MKLLEVRVVEESVAEFLPGTKKLKKELRGTCSFQGDSGTMSFNLKIEDIQTIQEVLMYKCMELAREV